MAGNTAVTNLTFTNDSTAPDRGHDHLRQTATPAGRSVTVTFTTGTDGGSGIATRQLQRAVGCPDRRHLRHVRRLREHRRGQPHVAVHRQLAGQRRCYKYRYVVTDQVGNQHIATSAQRRQGRLRRRGRRDHRASLSHWRLGEADATLVSSDSFTGTAGTSLTAHTGEIGATWTHQAGGANAVSSATRTGCGAAGSPATRSTTRPRRRPSADYSVEADLYVKSNLDGD